MKPLTMSVGKFGTKPVRRNFMKIGINNAIETSNRIADKIEKNSNGL